MRSLLGGSYPLRDGTRIRLRLARGSDARALRELLARSGESSELTLRRLVHYDPQRRRVLCATALIDGRETIVGVASLTDAASAPDLMFADERLAPGVTALLGDALLARAA